MDPDGWLHDWDGAAPQLRINGRCRRCLEQRRGTPPILFHARVRDDQVRLAIAHRVGTRNPLTQDDADAQTMGWDPDEADMDPAISTTLEAARSTPPGPWEAGLKGRVRFVIDEGPARRPPALRCYRCGWAPRIPRRDLWAKVKDALYDEHVIYV